MSNFLDSLVKSNPAKLAKIIASGTVDNVVGAPETLLSMLTGAAAQPVAGWAGILSGGNADMVERTQNALTFQPRSRQAQQLMGSIGDAAKYVEGTAPVRAYNRLADVAGGYSPALGAAVKTAPTALFAFASPEVRSAFRNVGAGMVENALKPSTLNTGAFMGQRGAAGVYESEADKMARALDKMGFNTRRDSSRVSGSEYVIAQTPDYMIDDAGNLVSGREFKLRVSNHKLPDHYEKPDFDISATPDLRRADTGGNWADAIKWISEKTGIPPVGHAKTAISKQQAIADMLEADRQQRIANAISVKNKAGDTWAKLKEWAGSLPDGAIVNVSKNTKNVSAKLPNGSVVTFGQKPDGMLNGQHTLDAILSKEVR